MDMGVFMFRILWILSLINYLVENLPFYHVELELEGGSILLDIALRLAARSPALDEVLIQIPTQGDFPSHHNCDSSYSLAVKASMQSQ